MENFNLENCLTPKQVVEKLDSYIIGQEKAKKCVAVALRNRNRRLMLPEEIRDEVAPKNILMIGPTGVGKTEIARRLAKLAGSPFLKVEATKYTEVGYVGRDVESMVRDLMAVGFNLVKNEMKEQLKEQCAPIVEEKLLDLLLPGTNKKDDKKKSGDSPKFNVIGNIFGNDSPIQAGVISISKESPFLIKSDDSKTEEKPAEKTPEQLAKEEEDKKTNASTREKFRSMLREGKLEERTVEITVHNEVKSPGFEMLNSGNMEDFAEGISNLHNMLNGSGRTHRKTVTIKQAREILTQEQLENMVDKDKVSDEAKKRVEQSGIIFIDEIDKIAVKNSYSGQGVSREGVQRDILPIVEGCDVNTKWGVINTTHILFIAAGAFSLAAPSDLIPELQGRFPLRVELDSLHKDEFKRILTEPKNALIKQYEALLGTEGVTVNFDESAVDKMASFAEEVNSKTENIGARRLHTIMETVLEELSFDADSYKGQTITIDSEFVEKKLNGIVENQDLQRYIL